jgi:hypothetical protein
VHNHAPGGVEDRDDWVILNLTDLIPQDAPNSILDAEHPVEDIALAG